MTVSFIIPVFKPNYDIFKKCIKSLVDQSYKDFEVIVVMDGKDSQAEMVCDLINDKRISFKTIEHSGVQKARNYGASQAKGDILWFWDSDCIIEPDTCKTFMTEFKEQPGIDFIYSGYRFLNERGGIPSESFNPFTLRCCNYISTCFPMRKKVFPGWDESLKSLQDWDLWLTITEKGGKGLFIPGYGFATLMPTEDSISGQNCKHAVWLDRVRAIKTKHNIPERKVCVTSMAYKHEGIRLAKLIGADYHDCPYFKPNTYDTQIQVGFSLHPNKIQPHVDLFAYPLKKKIIFWTLSDINEINDVISHRALKDYSNALNKQAIQYVEDIAAKKIMESAGFNVSVMPLPLANAEIKPLPDKPKILIEASSVYGQLLACVAHSLPDMTLESLDTNKSISDYTALISLNKDKSMSFAVKRMLLSGRNVISNIQNPFCGYVNDTQEMSKYVSDMVNTIRKRITHNTGPATDYWTKQMYTDKLMEVLK